MKNWKDILPKYAVLPLLFILATNTFVYFGTRLFTTNLVHHSMKMALDDYIPFVPFFISFYILAYVQWIVGYVVIARESKEHCYKFLLGEFIAKLICLGFFVFYPTMIVRPEITGHGIWESLTQIIYDMDAPNNLFPSIHCLESWVCFRGSVKLLKTPGWYSSLMLISSVLVFLSTVLVKQHVVIDIFGAIAAVEIGLAISNVIVKKVMVHG